MQLRVNYSITEVEAMAFVATIGCEWPKGLKKAVADYFVTQSRNTLETVVATYRQEEYGIETLDTIKRLCQDATSGLSEDMYVRLADASLNS